MCNFYSEDLPESLEQQVTNYCLSLLPMSTCATQTNQVTIMCTHEQAELFEDTRCSDIESTPVQTGFSGNRDFYEYLTVKIIVYKTTDL